MGNRYKEVLMTYLRRPFSSWISLFYSGWGVYQIAIATILPVRSSASAASLGVAILGGAIWLHFREQVVNPKRKLIPGCVGPHITAITVSGILVILASTFALSHAVRSFGAAPFALVVAIFGTTGCFFATVSLALGGLSLTAYLFILFGVKSEYFTTFLAGRHDGIAACLLGAGLISSVWAVTRMVRVSEEEPGYAKPIEADAFQWIKRKFHACGTANAAPMYGSSNPPRVKVNGKTAAMGGRRRWPASHIFGSGIIWGVLCFALVPVWLLRISGHLDQLDVVIDAQYVLPALFIAPAMLAASQCMRLWQYMEVELLRPATRRQFIRGIGIAMFFRCLIACGGASMLFLAAVFVAGGGLVGVLLMIPFAAAVVLAQPLVFVGFWWLAQYRKAALFGGFGAIVPLASPLFPTSDDRSFLIAAAVFALIGLLLIPIVYRHWLNLEMG